jgi:glycosyltransferase involved in cell wall biosynthesis
MTQIGIVIRTYNEAALLSRMFNAVMSQSEQSFEIILVDSGSTDNTLEIANTYDRVKIIQIPKENFSYGRALNIGIASFAERTKYIVMLSAHAIPCNKQWLSELIKPMQQDSRVMAVYGKQIPLPEHMSNPIVRFLASKAYPECYGDNVITTNTSHFFSNANGAITPKSWSEIQFDENLSGAEDVDWAQKIIAIGGWIAYQPTASVYHSHADTYRRYYIRQYREEQSFRKIDPIHYPIITKKALIRRIAELVKEYIDGIIQHKSIIGSHWDAFRKRFVQLIATFKGRRDVEKQ